jgi:hypothetical protein
MDCNLSQYLSKLEGGREVRLVVLGDNSRIQIRRTKAVPRAPYRTLNKKAGNARFFGFILYPIRSCEFCFLL